MFVGNPVLWLIPLHPAIGNTERGIGIGIEGLPLLHSQDSGHIHFHPLINPLLEVQLPRLDFSVIMFAEGEIQGHQGVFFDFAQLRGITFSQEGAESQRVGEDALTVEPGDQLFLPVFFQNSGEACWQILLPEAPGPTAAAMPKKAARRQADGNPYKSC